MTETLFEEYCLADPAFFETQSRWRGGGAGATTFSQARGEVPANWRRTERDTWVHLHPEGHQLPRQGWKVHVSACLDNAERVLSETYRYCLEHRLSFKFLVSRNVLRANNLKYAPRSSSGKLVTIYPVNESQLRTLLEDLGRALEGEPGPYILTDLRWGGGPLYVRYGAFQELFCPDANGTLVPAIAQPDGTLVPDRRTPVFQVPDWVTLPDFLAPHVAARQDTSAADFPYQVTSAIHFSNGGGVYLARRLADDRKVVLKEARPHAGLDGSGRDAVARLIVERDALRRLAGIPGVPALYEHRTAWEHEFLVQEYLSGDSLQTWLAENYPLIRATPSVEDIEHYTARAVAIAEQVDRIVDAIHARGMAMGDLHPTNLLVNERDEVRLTDFELAQDLDTAAASPLGYPGFVHPHLRGGAADRYAAAVLKLWLFLPLVELTALLPAKIETYLDAVGRRFPVPDGYLDQVREVLAPAGGGIRTGPLSGALDVDLDQAEPNWSAALKSMAQAILRSATPDRPDRLFPGDPHQFLFGGHGFGYGAAGVLWALHRTGAGRFPQLEEWLLAAASRAPREDPGFYSGLSGLAYVLAEFGHTDQARPLFDHSLSLVDSTHDLSLHSGLAGIGLTALAFGQWTGDAAYTAAATGIADRLIEAVDSDEPHGIDLLVRGNGVADKRLGARAGLMRGWSGVALTLLRCGESTGDARYLDAAVRAAHRDLDLCLWTPDDSLQVDGGFRVLAYLDVGGAGIALVAGELLAHRCDDRLATSLPALARACRTEFVMESQILDGRAGLMVALARLAALRPDLDLSGSVDLHLRRLTWHAVPYQGHLAFPGRRLRRLSMDVATGTAGVMLAVDAAAHGRLDVLPFLTDPRVPAPAPVPDPPPYAGRR